MEVRLQILHDLDLNMSISPKRYKNLHKVEKDYLLDVLQEMKGNNLIGFQEVENTNEDPKDICITKEGKKYLIDNV